jgi:hypothetical protein
MTTAAFRLVTPIGELHSSNHREHWAVVAKKAAAMRMSARFACNALPRLTAPVTLTVTFAWPDRRRRDLDNVSIKAAIDGATDAGIIPDDRSTVLRSVTRECAESLAPKGYVALTFTFAEAGSSGGNGADCGTIDASGTAPDLAPEPSLATQSTVRRTNVAGSKSTPIPAGGAR